MSSYTKVAAGAQEDEGEASENVPIAESAETPAGFDDVQIDADAAGSGKPPSRWARWAASGRDAMSKLSTQASGVGGGIGRARQVARGIDEVPDDWGMTAREMGHIERRWRSWSAAVRAPRNDVSGMGDERLLCEGVSAVPFIVPILSARGVFYGWVVALVAVVALALESPAGDLAIASVLKQAASSLKCAEPALARALALAHVFAALLAPLLAGAHARVAPGLAGLAGACALFAAMLLVATASGAGGVGVGVCVCKLVGCGVLTPLSTSALHGWWRSRRRVVDTAVAVTTSLVTLWLVPALARSDALSSAGGWRASFGRAAALAALIGVPVLLLLMPRPPSAYGQVPDGAALSAPHHGAGDEGLELTDLPHAVGSVHDAVRSAKFWLAQLALLTLRAHATLLFFMHPKLLPSGVSPFAWLATVGGGAAAAAAAIGLLLDAFRRKHVFVCCALALDALALALASAGQTGSGGGARAWGALSGALVSTCALVPGPLWCQLFGSVDAHRIGQLSASVTLLAAGCGVGLAGACIGASSVAVLVLLRLSAAFSAALAVAVAVLLHRETAGSVESWQALKAGSFRITIASPIRRAMTRAGGTG